MAPPPVKIFDPDNVILTFASQQIKGFAEDTFITVEQDGDSFTTVKGVDGEVVRTKVKGLVHIVRCTLMQTSDSNDVLSAIHNLDMGTSNGAGVAPLGIADKSGRFLFAGPEAWIVGPPSAEFGNSAKGREWMFHVVNADRFDGGS